MALAVAQSITEYRYGDPDVAIPELTASGATGTVNWTTSSGALNTATGAVVRLSPYNRTELVTITATDDSNTVIKTVQVFGTWPTQPKWEIELDIDPTTGVIQFPMAYEKREFQEHFDVLQFIAWHKKALIETSEAEDGTLVYRVLSGLPFYVNDIASGILAKVYLESVIRQSFSAPNFANYSLQMRGFDYAIPELPVTGPFAGTDFGALPDYGADEYFGV